DANVRLFFAKLMNSVCETGEPSEGRQVIVLHKHHVVQPKAMVNATAGDYCSLFQYAQPGRSFAGVQNLGRMVAGGIDKLPRTRCAGVEGLQKMDGVALCF